MEKNMGSQPQTVTYTAPIRSGGAAAGFNENDPRYQCCCGSMHVRTGAMVIAIFEIVMSSISAGFILFGSGGGRGSNKGSTIANCVITILVCALLIYGIKSTKRYFAVPHMVYQIIAIVGLIVVCIMIGLGLAAVGVADSSRRSYEDYQYRREEQAVVGMAYGVLIALLILCAIVAVLEIWFFMVILNTFRYLRDKEMAMSMGNPMVQYGGGGV